MQSPLLTVISFYGLVGGLIAAGIVVFTNPMRWNYALAMFLALVVGFVNLHTDDVQLPALLTLAFSFFLGSNDAKKALLWALLIPLCIPIGEILKALLSSQHTLLPEELFGSFLSFGFSFVGSYPGAVAKRLHSGTVRQ